MNRSAGHIKGARSDSSSAVTGCCGRVGAYGADHLAIDYVRLVRGSDNGAAVAPEKRDCVRFVHVHLVRLSCLPKVLLDEESTGGYWRRAFLARMRRHPKD